MRRDGRHQYRGPKLEPLAIADLETGALDCADRVAIRMAPSADPWPNQVAAFCILALRGSSDTTCS
jgi:hypothetical protein